MVTANDRIQGPYSTTEYEREFYVEGTSLIDQLNLDLVQALTAADIPLEKAQPEIKISQLNKNNYDDNEDEGNGGDKEGVYNGGNKKGVGNGGNKEGIGVCNYGDKEGEGNGGDKRNEEREEINDGDKGSKDNDDNRRKNVGNKRNKVMMVKKRRGEKVGDGEW
ncbi:17268_t:CDS:2 [Funneliformis caledonium]|uniref:17268_t:CDS:1 n=1 Tax=Funneliformis caledonium TaxID=1117310 RepID=A0A9N9B6Z1_9GLOM|nr:17268_t:CDS:2 [Funneliformis caledonium]